MYRRSYLWRNGWSSSVYKSFENEVRASEMEAACPPDSHLYSKFLYWCQCKVGHCALTACKDVRNIWHICQDCVRAALCVAWAAANQTGWTPWKSNILRTTGDAASDYTVCKRLMMTSIYQYGPRVGRLFPAGFDCELSRISPGDQPVLQTGKYFKVIHLGRCKIFQVLWRWYAVILDFWSALMHFDAG